VWSHLETEEAAVLSGTKTLWVSVAGAGMETTLEEDAAAAAKRKQSSSRETFTCDSFLYTRAETLQEDTVARLMYHHSMMFCSCISAVRAEVFSW